MSWVVCYHGKYCRSWQIKDHNRAGIGGVHFVSCSHDPVINRPTMWVNIHVWVTFQARLSQSVSTREVSYLFSARFKQGNGGYPPPRQETSTGTSPYRYSQCESLFALYYIWEQLCVSISRVSRVHHLEKPRYRPPCILRDEGVAVCRLGWSGGGLEATRRDACTCEPPHTWLPSHLVS